MGIEENKAKILLHLKMFNEGKIELADELISPDFVFNIPGGGEVKGPEGFKQMVLMTRNALPDLHYDLDGMVAEGDWVVARYTLNATHTGDFLGIPATGKKFTLKAAYCYRFENGKEIEDISYGDMLAFYQQIGVTPQIS